MIAPDLQSLAHPIDNLRTMDGNPRRGDVRAVMRSYEQFGQRKPVVALRDGTVIAGNHQLLAARELGWTEIAVVWVDDDDKTAKAFALADNRISDLGTYDDLDLVALLHEVATDPDLLASTGYGPDDIKDLLIATERPPALTDLANELAPVDLPTNDGRVPITVLLSPHIADIFRTYLRETGNDDTAIEDLLAAR